MVNCAALAGWLFALISIVSCSDPAVPLEQGVSQELARSRAELIDNLRYRLRFDIDADPQAPIAAQVEISFDLARAGGDLQLDFREEAASILAVQSNGSKVEARVEKEHVIVPAANLRSGRNVLLIEFLAGSSSLNRNPDYLYTLLVPDRARTLFPLFDQPDLKASYELTLVLPQGWKALSSAPIVDVTTMEGRSEHRFAPSDLISSYLFSFVAGQFEAITRDIDGRSMTLLHRETDADNLARNIDAIFELHAASVSWMEAYTGIDLPFQKLDFALIPSFQYRGMEHVGAILYRASQLLLSEAASDSELLQRAQLIAHETAHLWFGDLVTMRWFDDVWTKEVFANFMAGKIVNPRFPEIDHDLNFLVGHYPPAYAVDRSQGSNPIRQTLHNLNEAGQMYGAIIYHKAPIMMHQLEQFVGAQAFRDGLREYLRTYSYANAAWPDLIAILDARTSSDLAAWSQVWVNTPGRPHFESAAARPAASNARQLRQLDPAGQGRVWPQRFQVSVISEDDRYQETLVINTAVSELSPAFPIKGLRLYNADGYGYGLFPASGQALEQWHELTAPERGALLINSYENLLAGPSPDPLGYFAALLAIVQSERNQLLLELALTQMTFIYQSLLSQEQRHKQTLPLEEALWGAMLAQQDRALARLFFMAFAGLVCSEPAVAKLRAIWKEGGKAHGLSLSEEELINLAEILAIRLPEESRNIIARQLAQIENPDRMRRLEFVAPSLSADSRRRDAFFASLEQATNRQTEAWVIDALRNLHHPSRLQQAEKYLLPSLELLQEIQETGDIFFPSAWLMASLGNYQSTTAVATVRRFLEQRPGYSAQLRMKILQAADPMFRANRINPDSAGRSTR